MFGAVARSLAVLANAFTSFRRDVLCTRPMDSMSSLCTSFACCSGVNSGSRQCCGNRSNDPEMRYERVSGQ